ncbi:MAG TPA: response regulator [Ktedonobacteraceae bacterium]
MSKEIMPRNMLIVDDDPVMRDRMVDILSLEGYAPLVARNGQEALELLQREESLLVFLDLMMPVMDGSEVCRQLSANINLRQRHVIVVMSALDHLAHVAGLNVDATMPKPFVVEDVLAILKPYMG